MNFYRIRQKRIRNLRLLDDYKKNTIQIGIPVLKDEDHKVGLKNVGDVVLPSDSFGPVSDRNANGYFLVNKSLPKENRYVSTIWSRPYGNKNASEQAIDIYRDCYPRIEVEPIEIEMLLYEDDEKNKYIIANLTPNIREKNLKDVVNLFLEVFGECYIYKEKIISNDLTVTRRCNWEILKPGELPSENIVRNVLQREMDINKYDVKRLEVIESYKSKEKVEGIRGFHGYYAFVFEKYCVFESAKYGNATYIVKATNWEELSQLTKKELRDLNAVEDRIIHNKDWESKIKKVFKAKGIK
jgi:hypothetical protein